MERFDKNIHETPMVEINQKTQVKPLHANLHHTLREERFSSHTFEQRSMDISFSKKDPIIREFPTHVSEIKRNNVVRSGVDLAPHAEEGGALAPNRGILASL